MTTHQVTIRCDGCTAAELIITGALECRNVRLAAAAKGWRSGEVDLCPECVRAIEQPTEQLALGIEATV